MGKESFIGFLIILIAGGLFTSSFFIEVGKQPLDIKNIALLIGFAYLIYRASKDLKN